MYIFFIIMIILLILNFFKEKILETIEIEPTTINNNYTTKKYVMTPTELQFYKILKIIADKNNWIIFPQVRLENIIQIKDKNIKDRNRIKSRSIDYTIVNNENYKIICCIELDDYTHNTHKAKKIDNFKDEIFKQCNLSLHRIKVSKFYNMDEIETKIKSSI